MADSTEILSTQQRRAIEALLTRATVSAAAEAAGVGRNTIYRWRKQPAFIAALRAAERDATAELSRSLQQLSRSAVTVLQDAMKRDQHISHRLRATEIVLNKFLSVREAHDFEEQFAELRDRLNA